MNYDPGPSKEFVEANGWAQQPRPAEMLFDLIFDPNETHNLAGEQSARTILRDLRHRLNHWMAATNDPLRHGPVRAPLGARIEEPA